MAPTTPAEESIGRSLLRELCEEGQQMVTVTKLHKKNTELMFPRENEGSKYLDDYVTTPAFRNTSITWATRYLAEKVDEP